MKLAILTESGATPIVGNELADRICERVRDQIGIIATRSQVDAAIRKAVAAEEDEVREATRLLSGIHR